MMFVHITYDITYVDTIIVHYSTKTHLAVFYNQTLPTVSGQASNCLHVACDQRISIT